MTSILLTVSAYIDPSSGGMIFQALVVMFTVLSGAILFFSRQIRSTFARVKRAIRSRFEKEL